MRSIIRIQTLFCGLLLTMLGSLSFADDNEPIQLTLTPAAEPKPALKYQLLPSILEQRTGNAAVYYGKVASEQHAFFNNREVWDRIRELMEMPIDKIQDDELDASLVGSSSMFRFLELAARCESCDWQLQIRDEPFFEILLPEIQESRSFGRLLAARTRLQIARGDYDGALRSLQSGYALARNTSKSPTLISSLVGIANAQMMAHQIKTWAQQPDSPNLYWALTALPRPLIHVHPGLQSERDSIYLTFPELKDLERTDRSKEYWRETLHRVWKSLSAYVDMNSDRPKETVTLLVLRCYPGAKQALVDAGMDAEVVEEMPVAQVVLMNTMRVFNELRDEQFKWAYAPYPIAAEKLKEVNVKIKAAERRDDVLPLASIMLPAMDAVQRAMTRSEREIALLRTIEAIRMYASDNDGQLPKRLTDCPVPAPLDPVSGAQFTYEKKGDMATLTGPELRAAPLNYEIRIAK